MKWVAHQQQLPLQSWLVPFLVRGPLELHNRRFVLLRDDGVQIDADDLREVYRRENTNLDLIFLVGNFAVLKLFGNICRVVRANQFLAIHGRTRFCNKTETLANGSGRSL